MIVGPAAFAGQIKAGYAKTDVTPHEPVFMAGYDMRGTPSDGVHGNDKLNVRCLVFDDGSRKVAFVEGDVIIIRDTDEFRQTNFGGHWHSGGEYPARRCAQSRRPVVRLPRARPTGSREFSTALIATAQQALANLQPVRMAAGQGHSRIAMNRRQVRPAGDRFRISPSTKTTSANRSASPRPISRSGFTNSPGSAARRQSCRHD